MLNLFFKVLLIKEMRFLFQNYRLRKLFSLYNIIWLIIIIFGSIYRSVHQQLVWMITSMCMCCWLSEMLWTSKDLPYYLQHIQSTTWMQPFTLIADETKKFTKYDNKLNYRLNPSFAHLSRLKSWEIMHLTSFLFDLHYVWKLNKLMSTLFESY